MKEKQFNTCNKKLHIVPEVSTINRWARLVVNATFLLFTSILLTQCGPKPFSKVLRPLINSTNPVKLGPYKENIKDVTEHKLIKIPVAGAPDAGLIIYTSNTSTDQLKPILFLVHGGGWMMGTANQLGPFSKLLASEGFVIASLEYSLSPEYKYPTPIQQSAAAIAYIQTHAKEYGADPTKFFIGGNSAGAQISGQLGAMITNDAFEKQVGIAIEMPVAHLKGIILYSGPYNMETVGKNNFPGFRKYVWGYTGQKKYERYARIDELSVVKNVTSDYPATYMTTGDADPLEPQTYELEAILKSKGVEVTTRYWTGSNKKLPHDYNFNLETDAGQTAFKDVVNFINAKSLIN
ncbi:alpha/beta hydrolase [Pontibacter qinzhouensis]|uniref:Alpha/beta hydrolase n=1 Tax=Pontibacter qinzhouensis TaxID=2603253 RepID=A0A5C8IIF3_9BACT|nr:alpha/beta hydrolase [Pontibacter qinzhouensis]TXK21000.1 alpha/beta hydrolase [Pontibacter qinzhouensis]